MTIKLINLLINLKNNSLQKKEFLIFDYSVLCFKIIEILYKEGYIQSYKILKINEKNKIFINLRYYYNKPILKNLKLVSTSSKPKFLKLNSLIKLSDKKILFVISTNKGILTLKDCKKKKIGGKILFCC